ncbi:NAD(P)H-binding protein [Flavitalea sp. BT771]|uniref:SDR family oxidoreductase n=1 Tax=Flavitalea sp. BT771 TaxID=3063329 RepID=UPI0026E29548|nr:NAD(P)H-binding protein [Flavitalea sp. BT771]MDO6435197.1 NAD(P)H-binding protein [Flavitalea sp. BT771]MDV6224098.1 NAD(P)H-binding protein [Flavitalea sp. BT771]
MKIVITGSLGNIGKPLAINLVQKGHTVTVISSNTEKRQAIESLGAIPAIGTIQDADFLTSTFTGTDAVYCMNPLNFSDPDLNAWSRNIDNYIQAVHRSGVQRVVVLSGWVAHLLRSQHPEDKWNDLPGVSITLMRPGSFYTNFYSLKGMIKNQGFIAANYGGEDMIAFVSPDDIADAIADEIVTPVTGKKIRYVASDELTCNQAARIIGEAIGKPDLQWIILSDEQMLQGLEAMGIATPFAHFMVEMQSLNHSGKPQKDYYLNRPVLGKVKLRDFAKEYATWYATD